MAQAAWKTIRISMPVWQEIANRGKFGETPDDVLRRVFDVPGYARGRAARDGGVKRTRQADKRMSAVVRGGGLLVSFQGGPAHRWVLPDKQDKAAILTMRQGALAFGRDNGATEGQLAAIKKALTSAGYHLTK